MPRSFGDEISANLQAGHQLSRDDKKYILGCLDAGTSAREVARHLGCPHTTISSIRKRYEHNGTFEPCEQSNGSGARPQLSLDEKHNIIGRLQAGQSCRAIAREFHRSEATIRYVKKHYEQDHNVERREQKNRAHVLTSHEKERLLKLVERHPNATYEELQTLFNIPASQSTIYRVLRQNNKNKLDIKRGSARLEAQAGRRLTRQSAKLAEKSINKKKRK